MEGTNWVVQPEKLARGLAWILYVLSTKRQTKIMISLRGSASDHRFY